jgi:hypothetical protein
VNSYRVELPGVPSCDPRAQRIARLPAVAVKAASWTILSRERRRARGSAGASLVVDGFYTSTGGSEMQVRLLARAFRRRATTSRSSPRSSTLHGDFGAPRRRAGDAHRVSARAHSSAPCGFAPASRLAVAPQPLRCDPCPHGEEPAAVAGCCAPFISAHAHHHDLRRPWEFSGGILDPKLRDNRSTASTTPRAPRDTMQCISALPASAWPTPAIRPSGLRLIANAVGPRALHAGAATPAAHGAAPHVAFVGRIEPVKGLVDLLGA